MLLKVGLYPGIWSNWSGSQGLGLVRDVMVRI